MLHFMFHFCSCFANGVLFSWGSCYRLAKTASLLYFILFHLFFENLWYDKKWRLTINWAGSDFMYWASWSLMVQFKKEKKQFFINFQRYGVYYLAGNCMVWIQHVNMQVKFMYPFLILSFCGTQDIKSGKIRKEGRKLMQNTDCMSEWGFSLYV